TLDTRPVRGQKGLGIGKTHMGKRARGDAARPWCHAGPNQFPPRTVRNCGSMGADSPQRLGDFELIREVGRGGMGIVYEARQVSLNRKVALKVLSGGLGLTPKAVQRFRREAEAAAKLHHTNIVPVYATGEQAGALFYAMELIDGPSLDHVIKQFLASKCVAGAERSDAPAGSSQASAPATPNLEATGPYVCDSSPAQVLTSSALSSGSHYFDTIARMMADVADALDHAHNNGVI